MTQETIERIAAGIQASLPKRRAYSLFDWTLAITNIGGFAAAILAFFFVTPDLKSLVCIIILSVLLAITFGYLTYRELQGLDRYTQAIPHLHFAAHITRDALLSTNPDKVNSTVTRLIGSAAEVFSVITGRMCYVNLKILERVGAELRIGSFEEDDLASMGRHGVRKTLQNRIRDYDFSKTIQYYSLTSILSGQSSTSYVSNDVKRDLRRDKYYHPIFFDPTTGQKLPKEAVSKTWSGWPLVYRATLVVPIRALVTDTEFDVVGFLCVDCTSRNRFDVRLAPDLAGSYADLIYALYHHARNLGAKKSPLALVPKPHT